jgi:hypothetical protein
MPYELAFHPEALREWRTLSAGIREQFKMKLAERLIEPRIPASKLRGSTHRPHCQESCPLGLTRPPGGPTDDHATAL